jgi:hypothetical protein
MKSSQCSITYNLFERAWGEAFAYAGKKDGAQKQFFRAAQLDLMRLRG